MSRNVAIGVCVLAATVALGVAVNAGARAGGLVQTGDPAITHNGEQSFGNGTWTASASGADFNKPDPGGWAGHYSWFFPQTIPAGGVDAQLIVTAEGRGARHNACAKLVLSGIAISGGPSGNQLCTLAEVGHTESNTANFTLTPQSSSGSIEVQIQDGPQIHFDYGPGPNTNPCASAKDACETKEVTAPAPGKSKTLKGPVAKDASDVGVKAGSSAGNLAGTTIVGEGSVGSVTHGEAVASCWLTGPDSLFPSKGALQRFLERHDLRDDFDELEKDPGVFLRYCIGLVQKLAEEQVHTPHAAGGCAQQIVVTATEKGQKVVLKPAKANALPKGAVKYSCTDTGGGAQITVNSSSKKGLRGELGKTLDLGVVSAPEAPSGATLTFGFSS